MEEPRRGCTLERTAHRLGQVPAICPHGIADDGLGRRRRFETSKTARGGNTWFEQVDSSYGLVTLEAVDDQHAWILSGISLHRTIDGGQTWEAVDLVRYGAKDVDFVNRNHGWLIFNSQVLATVNGGLTWTPQAAPSATYLDVDFVDVCTVGSWPRSTVSGYGSKRTMAV